MDILWFLLLCGGAQALFLLMVDVCKWFGIDVQ
jgi:hypothetical protein